MTEASETGEVLDARDAARARIVALADAEISTATVKGSPRVRAYWQQVAPQGWHPSQVADAARKLEWCGVFTLWCYHQAKISAVPWELGRGFAYRLPRTDTPRPGDLFIIPQPFWHHGLVQETRHVDGKLWLKSIEGNTPDVRRRDRPAPSKILYYSIKPWLDAALGVDGARPA